MKTTLIAAALGLVALPAAAEDDLLARGEYLVQIMGCADCHMPRTAEGVPMVEAGLSGGNLGFELPGLGIFWPPNLTSDSSGLGDWSDDEIARALRTGERPDGRILAPVMPYMAYATLTDEDTAALVAYLRSMPPVATERLEPVADAAEAKAPFFRVTMPQSN